MPFYYFFGITVLNLKYIGKVFYENHEDQDLIDYLRT